MEKKLSGKVAVVTGASKGIGAQIAKELGEAGASVIVNYASSKEGADKVVQEIQKKGGKALAVQADVSKPEDIKRLFQETKKAFGKVNVLVNNAGVYNFAPLEEITPEHFYKMFDLNVLGLILTTQEAVKHFDPKGGSIINISSLVSIKGGPNFSVYSATKAAVDSVTKSFSKELGPKKIRVNAINPGLIETEGVQNLDVSEFRKDAEAHTPLGRIGQPTDIGPAALFFASDDSAWITGETLFITGGLR